MNLNELKEYLLNLGFLEDSRNSFTKVYQVKEELGNHPANLLHMTYKINKLNVVVKYKKAGYNRPMYKAKIKNLRLNDKNQLIGLKQVKQK